MAQLSNTAADSWRSMLRFIAAGLLMLLMQGCVAPGPRGEVPIGCWSGEGTMAFEIWSDPTATQPSGESAAPQSLCREYKTKLCIRPAQLGGHEVVELDIHSARGPLPGTRDMGDESHVRAALAKIKRLSDSTVLYRVVAMQYNPGPGEKMSFDEKAPPAGASCITTGGLTILQVQYLDGFVDEFRFEGSRLEKAGTFYDPKSGMIHWVEALNRSGGVSCACCQGRTSNAPDARH
jgi:hypothetical protein